MYVDYRFYSDVYHGTLDQNSFNKYEPRAEAYIRYYLSFKASVLDDTANKISGLQLAICAAIDAVAYQLIQKDSRMVSGGSGAAIKSETNDGYAVTYAIEQVDGETEDSFLRKKVYDAAYMYLLSTGLLNRKVGCCYDYKCGCDYL